MLTAERDKLSPAKTVPCQHLQKVGRIVIVWRSRFIDGLIVYIKPNLSLSFLAFIVSNNIERNMQSAQPLSHHPFVPSHWFTIFSGCWQTGVMGTISHVQQQAGNKACWQIVKHAGEDSLCSCLLKSEEALGSVFPNN